VWLRVRNLNSLVFSFNTTVRATRDSLRDAVHVCPQACGSSALPLQRHIVFEGVLRRYGLCWPVGDYFTLVDAASQLVETRAVATEPSLKCDNSIFANPRRLYLEARSAFLP